MVLYAQNVAVLISVKERVSLQDAVQGVKRKNRLQLIQSFTDARSLQNSSYPRSKYWMEARHLF